MPRIVRLSVVPIVILERLVFARWDLPFPLTGHAVIRAASPPGSSAVETVELFFDEDVFFPSFNGQQMSSFAHAVLLSPDPSLLLLYEHVATFGHLSWAEKVRRRTGHFLPVTLDEKLIGIDRMLQLLESRLQTLHFLERFPDFRQFVRQTD